MEERDLNSIIEENIKKYDINKGSFTKKTMSQLEALESYFSDIEEKYNEAVKIINGIDITTRGIASNTGVSKSTIYGNRDTIKKYLDCRLDELAIKEITSNNEKEKISKLQSDLNEVETLLNANIINFIESNDLKNENKKLKQQLERSQKRVEGLISERIELSKRIQQQEIELRKLKSKETSNIISINK